MDLRSRLRHPGRCGEPAAPCQPAGSPFVRRAERVPFDLDSLLAGYAAAAAPFDEMLAADGTVRPHWQRFVEGFAALGPEGRAAAAESTRRLLRESGIAFNVYADPDDRQHAWRLDLVPVLLPEQEWDALAARDRAAGAPDRRGPGRPARRRRPCCTTAACRHPCCWAARAMSAPASIATGAPRRFLYTYACDVARTATGDWVVLGDQTDTAIGNGYVLASRVALSHGLAESLPRLPHQAARPLFPRPAGELPGAVPARRRPDRAS